MLKDMLSDGLNDSWSSKRVVTFIAFTLCAIAFLANMFFGYKVESFMFESMIYLAMVGLGATASEKFAPKSNNYQPQNHNLLNTRTHYGIPFPKQPEREI